MAKRRKVVRWNISGITVEITAQWSVFITGLPGEFGEERALFYDKEEAMDAVRSRVAEAVGKQKGFDKSIVSIFLEAEHGFTDLEEQQ